MKYLLKIFIFSFLLTGAAPLASQVTSVEYSILYNNKSNLFDCFIYIDEGSTNSIRDRVQFNSQYSLVVPSGATVNIASTYMPLLDNQNYSGIQPVEWSITNKDISKEVSPEYNFFGITPQIAPTGFYNDLSEGDLVKLFSLNIEGEKVDLSKVRLFDNIEDPKRFALSVNKSDFSNGITIGSYIEIFKGIKYINQVEANYTSLENNNKQ